VAVLAGRQGRRGGWAGLVTSCVRVVASTILLPASAAAQHAAATATAPTATAPTAAAPTHIGGGRENDHQNLGERALQGRPEGKLAEQERDDNKLRAAFEERLKALAALIKKSQQDEATDIRRRQQADHLARDRGASSAARTGDAQRQAPSPEVDRAADDRRLSSVAPGDNRQPQAPPSIPSSIRSTTAHAETYRRGDETPLITGLGGAAPRDPKWVGVLDGAAVHHKL
jgi:Spy/CpxP family protein refolding chaperone